MPRLDIKYHDDITLLEFHMMTNIKKSATKSWAMLTANIRAQVQRIYHKTLILEHRIHYVKDFLLARLWFKTQIFPAPTPTPLDFVRQMNTPLAWFLWKGAIFSVPLSTLQQLKDSGGRALIRIMGKYMTLFMLRMEKQGRRTYFHCRRAHEVATKWTNTEPSTNKEDPNKIRLSLSIQHRIGIRTHERNLRTSTNL